MSLQTIFNISNKLKIDRRKLVGVQYSRSQIPKTELTPTKNPWRITLTAPDQSYYEMRSVLQQLDTLDRYQPEVIQLGGNANMNWMFRYQGVMTPSDITGLSVVSFVGNQLTITGLPGLGPTEVLFEKGDFIQIGSNYYPFTSTTQVLRGSGLTVTITTHRPNILTNDVTSNSITVGSDCRIAVFCPNMPTYTLIPGARRVVDGVILNNAIVQWDSDFQLYEWLGDA